MKLTLYRRTLKAELDLDDERGGRFDSEYAMRKKLDEWD